jgi:hypothetical protein
VGGGGVVHNQSRGKQTERTGKPFAELDMKQKDKK